MPKPKLLDLFCKAGGAGMGYHRAGFEVVGVDIEPQPRYPFTFVQSDALAYVAQYGWMYDAIHASPPCQRYSRTRSLPNVKADEYPALIEATRFWLETIGVPYIIENVVGAPLRNPVMLCGTMFDLRVFRHRLFESNVFLFQPPHQTHDGTTGSHRGYSRDTKYICVAGNNYDAKQGREAMGIDWMSNREQLSESIPPAYTEYLGRQLMTYVMARRESGAA